MIKKLILVACAVHLISCNKSTKFELLSLEITGVDFNNVITENDTFHILNSEYIYNGGGVGVGDLDNDGDPDLIFVGNMVPTSVYVNNGDFKFSNVTNSFEGLSNDQWFSGISIADINGDGWKDVYITSTMDPNPEKRKNRLWINNGDARDSFPTFQERAEEYGIADTGYSEHSGFFDYDLDGDLDLYILNNTVNKQVSSGYRSKIIDGSASNNDKLYRNNGDNTFSDVTIEAGITYEGFGLGLVFSDLNKDGYPDIYIANDYIANDLLYMNQKDGTFKNESHLYLSYQSKFSMGNDISDINNDGLSDIMSTDMMPENYSKKKQTINGNSYSFYVNDKKYGYEHQHLRNMLHRHNGFINGEMLPFSEIGQMLGIFQTEWSWSPLFADFDNDGDRDLMVTNGYPKDLTDKDFIKYKSKVYGYIATDQHVLNRVPEVKVHNYAFEQKNQYSFVDKSEEWGMGSPSFSYGASFVDLDLDGDLDYVTNNINDPAFIYKNNTNEESGKNYILINLEGSGKNTQGIGAKVEVWSEGTYQYYEHFLSRGYISSVDPTIHFGFADKKQIDSIKVTWPTPSQSITSVQNIQVNQRITLSESDGTIQEPASKPGHLMFQQVPDLIPYTHAQTDNIDFFQHQNILPHKFSQIGPVMAWGDLNNDGSDDLVIGATDILPTIVFLNSTDGFIQSELKGLSIKKDCSESGLVIFDADGDGDNDLVTISGGYINEDPEDYKHFIFYNNDGVFSKTRLPIPSFPASTVKVADFDQDGDLDLFIGARVAKGNFPLAENSFILKNNSGSFTVHQALKLGMVTDAIWSDYNGDGWDDLIIAREWNSIAMLKNESGKEFKFDASQEFLDKKGSWNTIGSGDFDQDGDLDLILGNLGENHRFNISAEFPMKLYAIDLDQNGTIDPLTTAFWPNTYGKMEEYPINYLDELAAQSPHFRKIFDSYTQFSYSNVYDIFNPESISEEFIYYINTTSSYVLWNEKGTFRWEALPKEVQESPVKKMIIRDFNGDSFPDILLGGNDYTYDVSTGNYDANKGLLMISKGAAKGFEILGPKDTGFLIEGQVESMYYLEGSPSFVVVGINREKVVVFEHLKE